MILFDRRRSGVNSDMPRAVVLRLGMPISAMTQVKPIAACRAFASGQFDRIIDEPRNRIERSRQPARPFQAYGAFGFASRRSHGQSDMRGKGRENPAAPVPFLP